MLVVEQSPTPLQKEVSGTIWYGGRCRRRPSPCLRPVRPPVTTTPHSSSPLSSFSRYHFFDEMVDIPFFDKILKISLVFTHGITAAWVNHNRCFVKKCILMFRAMHGHLANFFAYNSKHHVDTVFYHFTTMLVSLLVVIRCKLLPRVF